MKMGESEKGRMKARSGMVGARRPLAEGKGWKKTNLEEMGHDGGSAADGAGKY